MIRVVCVLLILRQILGKDLPKIYARGDVIIGGLFPVHEKGIGGKKCGDINLERGIQRLEAMRFAIKDINEDPKLLPGITLGYKILDTCSDPTHALDQSLDFVMSTFDVSQTCPALSIPGVQAAKPEPIMAVVGGSYSEVSIQVANLLRLFQIPQISYASTSAELSKKDKYGYFMRTVPPDNLQAKALVDIVHYFGWTYVSTVASEGEYGDSGIEAFRRQFEKKNGQCIAASLRISRSAKEIDFIEVIKNLYKLKKARVVILFVKQDDAFSILQAATQLGYYDDFIWVATDGWGNGLKVVAGNEKTAHGALTITLQSQHLKKFDEYFLNLTVENNKENIWFQEYWEKYHSCQFNNSRTPIGYSYNQSIPSGTPVLVPEAAKRCDGQEKYVKFEQESKTQFVYDAVYAIAVSLDRLLKELCRENFTELCERMVSSGSTRSILLEYIRDNKRDDPYGNAIRFDANGDSVGFYNIMNYRYDKKKRMYEYAVVGSWEDNNLFLNSSDIIWPGPPLPDIPKSICSLECELGWRKEIKDDYACCWSCIKCEDNEYLIDQYTCKACLTAEWPNSNKTGCYKLELQYVKWESPFAIIPSVMSLLGLCFTVATVIIFIKHANTPVVKAAGRELSYMLLSGCIICYITVFLLLFKPSLVICVIQRLLLGSGFAIIYSSLLIKTNRIYRIFTSATKTTKRPACISPKSQVIIASLLASVQILVFAVWIVLEPPGVITDTPIVSDKSIVVLKCDSKELSVLLSLTYNMLLITTCTVYAILTRKIPSNFNESKFIGFTMYTTCIIWLSFVPIYFGLKTSFQIQVITLCTAVFLSSTIALVCLFGPKIYIIIFHPHKNKRKATSERQKFSAATRSVKTGETDHMLENRTQTSFCQPTDVSSPKHNGSGNRCSFLLSDSTIPEEVNTSLLIEKVNSMDSVFSQDDEEKEVNLVEKKYIEMPNNGKTHHNNDSPSATLTQRCHQDECEVTPLSSKPPFKSDDILELEKLKSAAVFSVDNSLLQSLEKLSSQWRFIDSTPELSLHVTPSTTYHSMSVPNYPELNGDSSAGGSISDLPERLI